ncbi:hypothetical protein BGY98DRAFT_990566, partial [Russula aff. rugulosa BPL654]
KDAAVVASDVAVFKKLLCLVDGFFIWEFMTTLDYEWNIIQERIRFRWTIWIYLLIRVATLAMVAINIFLNLDVTTPINCEITMVFQFVLAYLVLASSSLLIVLRIIAIWENKIIVAVATGMWVTNIAFLIQGRSYLSRFHSTFGDENCVTINLESIRLSTIVALVTDIILLTIMVIGLFRMRRHGGGTMALGRLLWSQGVIWLVIAVVADLTPTVFQIPWVITMSIAASRMYRSLSEFLSSDISQNTLPTN